MFGHKYKAALIHFALSVILIVMLVGTILFFWFPPIFLSVTDFKEVVTLIITVDLVLGPILTFIVFKPKKKSLKLDLSIIGAIQLSALVYGAYTLYQIHPVYITFNKDRFSVIQAIDAFPENSLYDEYKVSKFSSGNLAYAKMPKDFKKQEQLLQDVLKGGADLEQRVDLYEPYSKNIDEIIARGLDKDLIFNHENNNQTNTFLKKNKFEINKLAFLPLTNGKKDAIIVLDKLTATPIATININPWELSRK